MDETLSIRTELGTVIAADPADPLVLRRNRLRREHLRQAIRALPPDERAALRLAARDGRFLPEIAAALNRSPAEAERTLRHGLTRLRTLLLEQLETPGDG